MQTSDHQHVNSLFSLISFFVGGEVAYLILPNGGSVACKRILGIELEDGSGKNFNVTYYDMSDKKKTVFIKAV